MLEELDALRREMGFVDNAVVSLVLARMEVARRMGGVKKAAGLPVLPEGFTLEKALQARREKARAVGAGERDEAVVASVFAVLVQAAVDVEEGLQK